MYTDKKTLQQKRKRPNVPEGSPEHVGIGSPRGAGTVSRLSVPLSERQQMALLMRMQDESSVGGIFQAFSFSTFKDKIIHGFF